MYIADKQVDVSVKDILKINSPVQRTLKLWLKKFSNAGLYLIFQLLFIFIRLLSGTVEIID